MAIYFNTPAAAIDVHDRRVAEILELAAVEGIKLPMSVDAILEFENRGHVVDLVTGVVWQIDVERVTPSGIAVNHLLTPVTDDEVEQTVNSLFGQSDEECAPAGTLQALIDEGEHDEVWYEAELQDLRDGMEFGDFVRGGC